MHPRKNANTRNRMRLPLSVLSLMAAPVAAQQPVPALVAEYDRMAAQPLWPGFAPAVTPLAIFDGTRTWLVRHPHPPAGFQSTTMLPGARVIVGRLAEVRANTHADINGTPTATLLWPAAGGEPTDLAAVLVHEAFHVYQARAHPSWYGNEAHRFTYPATDSTAQALQRLETEALRRALGDQNRSACWAGRALALRRLRAERIGPDAIAYERGNDLNEGLATWVQWVARRGRWEAIIPDTGFGPDGVRERTYAVGPAQAELLQRFMPRWQAALTADSTRTLDGLLAEALATVSCRTDLSPMETDSVASLAGREVASVLAARGALRQGFLDRPGWWLVIELPPAAPLWPQGFDPLNVTPLPDGEVLHRRQLKLGGGPGALEVLGAWALTAPAGAHPLFNGIRAVTFTGLEHPPEITARGDSLLVRAPGIDGRFTGLIADTAGDRVTLRPR